MWRRFLAGWKSYTKRALLALGLCTKEKASWAQAAQLSASRLWVPSDQLVPAPAALMCPPYRATPLICEPKYPPSVASVRMFYHRNWTSNQDSRSLCFPSPATEQLKTVSCGCCNQLAQRGWLKVTGWPLPAAAPAPAVTEFFPACVSQFPLFVVVLLGFFWYVCGCGVMCVYRCSSIVLTFFSFFFELEFLTSFRDPTVLISSTLGLQTITTLPVSVLFFLFFWGGGYLGI